MDPAADQDVGLEASVIGLGIVLRSVAPALERVTLQQYRVLVLLVTRGSMRAGDLASELGLLPSGITRIVSRLTRDGMVEKQVSRSSGREVLVSALPPATALVGQVFEARRAAFDAVLQRMTPDERVAVRAAAAAIVRTAGNDELLDAHILLGDDRR